MKAQDLFGNPVSSAELNKDPAKTNGTRRQARASDLPGPAGEKCRSCRYAYGFAHGKKTYFKCGIARHAATRGPGTDIRLKDPACARWEREEADFPEFLTRQTKEKTHGKTR